MKNPGKREEIIFVILRKRGICYIFLELFKEYHKNMTNFDKWYNVAMRIYF